MQTKSYSAAEVQQSWYIVDADDVVLGRLASRVASILRGKNKPTYTPNANTGDFVVIVNAEKIKLTGNKEEAKQYHRYTGYVGGVRTTTPRKLRETHPERIITHAVKGMLPKGPLGRQMFKKLKVYAGPEHPHKAQKPEALKF